MSFTDTVYAKKIHFRFFLQHVILAKMQETQSFMTDFTVKTLVLLFLYGSKGYHLPVSYLYEFEHFKLYFCGGSTYCIQITPVCDFFLHHNYTPTPLCLLECPNELFSKQQHWGNRARTLNSAHGRLMCTSRCP